MTTQKNGGSEAFSEPLFLWGGSAAIKNKNFFQKNLKFLKLLPTRLSLDPCSTPQFYMAYRYFVKPLSRGGRNFSNFYYNFFQKNPKVFETPADIYIRCKCAQACVR